MKSALGLCVLALCLPVAAQAQTGSPLRPAPPSVVGRVLTLDECVAIALETQPQIQATLSDYAAARYRVNQALAPLLPQLSGAVSAMRSRSIFLSTDPTTLQTVRVPGTLQLGDTFLAQVQLSQLLFDFGQTQAATEAARKLAEVAVENVELQRQLIALAVNEAYTNVLFAQRLIRVQEAALQRAELNLKSTMGMYQAGVRPKSDVARAAVDVANAKVSLIQARNALKTARVALNTSMAIEVDAPTEVEDNLGYQPVTLDRRELRAEALRQRPEYRQAKLQAAAAEANEQRAARSFLPTVSGSAAYGGSQAQLNESWTVGPSLSWTLFDGGNLIAKFQEAKTNTEAARQRVASSGLDIVQNVEQAAIAVEEAQERILATKALIASAQENFRLAQGRFDAGVGTILELTDAQLALTQAQNTEAQALSDDRIALAQLDRAVGRR